MHDHIAQTVGRFIDNAAKNRLLHLRAWPYCWFVYSFPKQPFEVNYDLLMGERAAAAAQGRPKMMAI